MLHASIVLIVSRMLASRFPGNLFLKTISIWEVCFVTKTSNSF